MKKRLPLLAALSVLALATAAHAVKVQQNVTPATAAADGFTVTTKERTGDILRFTVVRDLSKARWTGRDATLSLRGAKGVELTCRLEPETSRKRNTVSYWFDLSKERVPDSFLTIAEIQTADGDPEDVPKLIGGGTYYEFRLAEFARK